MSYVIYLKRTPKHSFGYVAEQMPLSAALDMVKKGTAVRTADGSFKQVETPAAPAKKPAAKKRAPAKKD